MHIERLDDKIIRTTVEPGHPIMHVITCRDDQHRGRKSTAPQSSQQRQPVQPWQVDIEDQGLVVAMSYRSLSGCTILQPIDCVTLLGEPSPYCSTERFVVFY
jgi:hypothetical protein